MSNGRDWFAIAGKAAAIVGSPEQGGKEDALANACEKLKIPAKTLRSYLAARRFADSVGTGKSKKLQAMPAVAVEIIARWHRRDPDRAMEATDDYARGSLTVRGLLANELKSRKGREGFGGRRLEAVYRSEIAKDFDRLRLVWPDDRSGLIWKPTPPLSDPLGVADFVVSVFGLGVDDRMALLIVGPYTSPETYRARAKDWCLKALGMTYFYGTVALICPPGVKTWSFTTVLEKITPRPDILVLSDTIGHGF